MDGGSSSCRCWFTTITWSVLDGNTLISCSLLPRQAIQPSDKTLANNIPLNENMAHVSQICNILQRHQHHCVHQFSTLHRAKFHHSITIIGIVSLFFHAVYSSTDPQCKQCRLVGELITLTNTVYSAIMVSADWNLAHMMRSRVVKAVLFALVY